MAFQVSDTKISGTIDGLSFYNSEFGWLVRRKGGPTPKQFKRSPAFALARNNSNEFTLCSKAASSIRKLIIDRTGIKDKTLYHRLIKLMRLLANADKTSPFGKRDPLIGMRSAQATLLLKNFEFSTGLTLYDILISTSYIKKTIRIKKRQKRSYMDRIYIQSKNVRALRAPVCFAIMAPAGPTFLARLCRTPAVSIRIRKKSLDFKT